MKLLVILLILGVIVLLVYLGTKAYDNYLWKQAYKAVNQGTTPQPSYSPGYTDPNRTANHDNYVNATREMSARIEKILSSSNSKDKDNAINKVKSYFNNPYKGLLNDQITWCDLTINNWASSDDGAEYRIKSEAKTRKTENITILKSITEALASQ